LQYARSKARRAKPGTRRARRYAYLVSSTTLDVPFWERQTVLRGKDGLKFWTPSANNGSSGKGVAPERNATDSDSHEAASSGRDMSEGRLAALEKQLAVVLQEGGRSEREAQGGRRPSSPLSRGNSMLNQSPTSATSPASDELKSKLGRLEGMIAGLVETLARDRPGLEGASSIQQNLLPLQSDAAPDPVQERTERIRTEQFLLDLVADGPCALESVKAACAAQEPPVSWELSKKVRRDRGIVQCRETVDGKIQRFWRKGTPAELDRLRASRSKE